MPKIPFFILAKLPKIPFFIFYYMPKIPFLQPSKFFFSLNLIKHNESTKNLEKTIDFVTICLYNIVSDVVCMIYMLRCIFYGGS